MFRTLTGEARKKISKRLCKDVYSNNIEDIRALIMAMNKYKKYRINYIVDKHSGQLWPKHHVCKRLKQGVTNSQVSIDVFLYVMLASILPLIPASGAALGVSMSENKTTRVITAAMGGLVGSAVPVELLRRYVKKYKLNIDKTLKAIKTLQSNDKRKLSGPRKKQRKSIESLKYINVHDLRRQLIKMSEFKPLWLFEPNGKARSIQNIIKAYYVY